MEFCGPRASRIGALLRKAYLADEGLVIRTKIRNYGDWVRPVRDRGRVGRSDSAPAVLRFGASLPRSLPSRAVFCNIGFAATDVGGVFMRFRTGTMPAVSPRAR